jgi:hypothetical protein
MNEMATKNPSSGFELSCMIILLSVITTEEFQKRYADDGPIV